MSRVIITDTFPCSGIVGSEDKHFTIQGTYDVRIILLIFLDTDECSTGIHTCDVNAICVNKVGSYECRCKDSYLGDGRNCIGI